MRLSSHCIAYEYSIIYGTMILADKEGWFMMFSLPVLQFIKCNESAFKLTCLSYMLCMRA